jgi:hypothetical protein
MLAMTRRLLQPPNAWKGYSQVAQFSRPGCIMKMMVRFGQDANWCHHLHCIFLELAEL